MAFLRGFSAPQRSKVCSKVCWQNPPTADKMFAANEFEILIKMTWDSIFKMLHPQFGPYTSVPRE
jgi:hypothetical protein